MNQETTLIIMAAGLGSRYKGGIKALMPVGPCGELIMDYSVYDAIKAGFKKIVFVIRREIEADFNDVIGKKVSSFCKSKGAEMHYVLQDINDIPYGNVPYGRIKPWGTCHAVLAAKRIVNGPFCVINADDYYGPKAFESVQRFLTENTDENVFCMAGFELQNTLSEFGGVTRGICKTDSDGNVVSIKETKHIMKAVDGAVAEGVSIPSDTIVSMNMWGFKPCMMKFIESGFESFLRNMCDPLTDEFLLPVFASKLISENRIVLKVVKTPDKWFGVTYAEDHDGAVKAIRELADRGIYPVDIYQNT